MGGNACPALSWPLSVNRRIRSSRAHCAISVPHLCWCFRALSRLGLARAYAVQGDTAKTRAAYQDFLTLWKDADPDIPILKQAKAEYAKLQ